MLLYSVWVEYFIIRLGTLVCNDLTFWQLNSIVLLIYSYTWHWKFQLFAYSVLVKTLMRGISCMDERVYVLKIRYPKNRLLVLLRESPTRLDRMTDRRTTAAWSINASIAFFVHSTRVCMDVLLTLKTGWQYQTLFFSININEKNWTQIGWIESFVDQHAGNTKNNFIITFSHLVHSVNLRPKRFF